MSLAVVHSRALIGIEAPVVQVEVHLANGLPGMTIVGLPDTEVREARDRVRAALHSTGMALPPRRVTVNLAPADLPKDSARWDLPIALGLLAASGQLPTAALTRYEFAGELSLTGDIRPIQGAMAIALGAQRDGSGRILVLPRASASEAALVEGAPLAAVDTLTDLCHRLREDLPLPPPARPASPPPGRPLADLADIKGQTEAKHALEVAAAGGHGLLMYGPPGTGKSMLAHRLPGLLPPLSRTAALEAAAVQSVAGCFDPAGFGRPAFRAPHHSATLPALIGGGNPPRPGEITLAHHGVLFLDELPHFDKRTLDALREPLETARVAIARAGRRADYPAAFQLVAAMNPCPCGLLGHPRLACKCTPDAIERYRRRLSGPLIDRIDLHVEVPLVSEDVLAASAAGESSAEVAQRVAAARALAYARQGKLNAHLEPGEVDVHCMPDALGLSRLKRASVSLGWSARGFHRVLRVARTMADLAGTAAVSERHVAQAIAYRRGILSNSA